MSCSPSSVQKSEVYVDTQVDRDTRCIINWRVLEESTEWELKATVDESPQAQHYYSDAFGVYRQLIYDRGQDQALSDKSRIYPAEGCNAELRHYLARWRGARVPSPGV